tara:strand:+ start:423 stop:2243 length:1821 start_codon:yes stop_codon:yes gene_type:complete
MAFDPDAYLAQKKPAAASGFDPDAYLAQQRQDVMPTGRTWSQVGREAISNIPESGVKLLGGLYTAVTRPRETLEQLGEVLTGAYARFIPQEWMARPDKAAEFIAKADAVGGVYRDRYGSVEALKNTIATDPVGFAADVSTLAGAGAVAAPGRAGQVLGTVSRVTDPTRVITAPAAAAGRAGINALERAAIGGKANVLLEAAEGRAPDIINALRQQPEIVPGATPTAGEAAAPVGATRFSALQESAEKILPSAYMARRQAQDAARAASIREVGGTEAQLTSARMARAAEANLLYGQAGAKAVAEDATLKALQSRPSVKKAFDRAKDLAAEEGASFGASGSYTAADMHYVKMALDDLVQNPATYGIGKVEASKIAGTRKEFINWLEGQVPEYGAARSAFQARSKPINQMEVGQYLESKLTSALQGEEKLRPAAFAGAVEAAPQTIQRAAAGAPRYEKLSDVLTPDQVNIVENIRKDLARQAKYREQARAARPAGPSAETAGTQLLVEAAGGVTMPTLLNRVTTVANAILKRLAGKIDRKLAIEIATDMLQPETAALALEAAQRRAGTVQEITGGVRRAGAAAQRAAAPAAVVTNALAGAEARQNQLAR